MFNVILLTLHLLTATISGKVVDPNTDAPIADAQVQLVEFNLSTVTDVDGKYTFENITEGTYTLKVLTIGYKPYESKVVIKAKSQLININLQSDNTSLEEVVVQSINSEKRSGTTYSNITAKDLKAGNLGQDLPILLNASPSVVTTSDAGAGVGYTGIRIRGTDASRINVTINGVPTNDAEEHGMFWVNMPDFASSVGSLQIQRGVGTSSNGAAAFGASVNIQTSNLSKEAYGQISSSAGSFNTFKNTFQAGSGLINNKFAFEARLSKITSDGFMDRASSDLKSFFASGAYFGKKSVLKANIFSGKQKTYQAWYGVPEDTLRAGNRTHSEFKYANQTDNYQQDFYQLIYTKEVKQHVNINAALFYTRGRGYYEEYKEGDKLAKYKINNLIVGNDTIEKSNIIRQKWLDNHFYGFTLSANYEKNKVRASIGGGWNQYLGGHYGKVIWAQFASNSSLGDKYYNNNSVKDDGNIYGKIYYQLLPKINVFADLQGRFINYSLKGFDQYDKDLTQSINYFFFNPKAGLTWDISANHYLYASASIGQKEPTRSDFTAATALTRPKSERLFNVESGVKGKVALLNYSANIYLMQYKNQLVVTGNLDDVGNNLRANVDNSYRTGVELQLGYKLSDKFNANLNLTLSSNKIKEYNQIVYDTVNYIPTSIKYNNSNIAMSPNVIFGGQLAYTPFNGLVLSLLPKYVGKQYLDNTSNETRKLNAYTVADIRINYEVPQKLIKNLSFAVQVNNVLNRKYESNGYTYTNFDVNGKEFNNNYYYPQAGTNFLAGATLRF